MYDNMPWLKRIVSSNTTESVQEAKIIKGEKKVKKLFIVIIVIIILVNVFGVIGAFKKNNNNDIPPTNSYSENYNEDYYGEEYGYTNYDGVPFESQEDYNDFYNNRGKYEVHAEDVD